MMRELHIVVGGQYGSEGKGHLAGQLAKPVEGDVPDDTVAIRVGGPNAGHSVIDEHGNKWKLRQIPTAAVTNPMAKLALAQRSVIDPSVLLNEIHTLEDAGFRIWDRLLIDRESLTVQDMHKRGEEGLVQQIGSTGSGVGAARADHVMREAPLVRHGFDDLHSVMGDTAVQINQLAKGRVIIEASQGFGLGLHAGFYPKCTSSDCTAMDAAAAAGVPPWHARKLHVWTAMRTYPIRVAGDSGYMFNEIDWGKLNVQPERTTVTNKVRRVGEWDPALARRAMKINGGKVALMFFDYVFPETHGWEKRGELEPVHWDFITKIDADTDAPVMALGTGPNNVIWL